MAMQTVLHVLCVPRPFTRQHVPVGENAAQVPKSPLPNIVQETARSIRGRDEEGEVLLPGALHADCTIIRPGLTHAHRAMNREDLSLGDEAVGQKVWEVLEEGVKVWGEKDSEREQESKAKD